MESHVGAGGTLKKRKILKAQKQIKIFLPSGGRTTCATILCKNSEKKQISYSLTVQIPKTISSIKKKCYWIKLRRHLV